MLRVYVIICVCFRLYTFFRLADFNTQIKKIGYEFYTNASISQKLFAEIKSMIVFLFPVLNLIGFLLMVFLSNETLFKIYKEQGYLTEIQD